MAIFHLSVKTVSRSAGRSATAAAAYRAGVEIVDERTGQVHDYTRRSGVDRQFSPGLVLPADAPSWASDQSALWNAAEASETRKNSTVAREFEVALPAELTELQRADLVRRFAAEIVDRHSVAVDAWIHEPASKGDLRNWHAHVLTTTRRLGPDGFGEKARELDDRKTGEVEHWRARWAELVNEALAAAGSVERVDHRSLDAQRIEAEAAGDLVAAVALDREPGRHRGPAATNVERRQRPSRRGDEHRARQERRQEEHAVARASLAEVEAEIRVLEASGIGRPQPGLFAAFVKKPAQSVPKPPPVRDRVAGDAEAEVERAKRQREAWDRYEASSNSWAPAGEPDADVWHQRRVGWLESRYRDEDLGRRLADAGVRIDWVSFGRGGDQVAQLKMKVGSATVCDDGLTVRTNMSSDDSIALMIEVAKAKGWTSINLKGHDDFIKKSILAARAAGLGVKSINGVLVLDDGPIDPAVKPKQKGPRM